MKSTKLTTLSALFALTLLFSGCSQRLVDFTVISSKNHSLKFDKAQGKRVTGKSFGFLGLGANIKDAMDKALQSAGPQFDLLIDGVVKVENYPFVAGYVVEGTAINSTQLRAMLGEKGFELWCKENNVLDPAKAESNN
ncbi:MAG: hypothetical protein ACO1OQ_07755 [Rufibacter sp.]